LEIIEWTENWRTRASPGIREAEEVGHSHTIQPGSTMEGEEDEEEEVAHTQMVAKRSATKADAKREQGKVQFF